MDGSCFICGHVFIKKGKTYNRYRVETLASPRTFLKVFPLPESCVQSINQNAFLCKDCVSFLNKKTVPKKKRKSRGSKSVQRQWPGTPVRHSPSAATSKTATTGTRKRRHSDSPSSKSLNEVFPESHSTTIGDGTTSAKSKFKDKGVQQTRNQLIANGGFTKKAADMLTTHKYKQAFGLLVACSEPAKAALLKVAYGLLKNERKALQNTDTPFNRKLSLETIKNFEWEEALEAIDKVAPITLATLKSMFPDAKSIAGHRIMGNKRNRRKQTLAEAQDMLNARTGTALSVVLFTRNPQRFKFLPSAMSVELWRQGSSQKTIATLNRMGISQGTSAARAHVDELGANHDADMLMWKKTIEERADSKPKKFRLDKKLDIATSNKLPDNHGYGVCWDNVQVETTAMHQGLEKRNNFMMWGLTFGISHRVPTLHLCKDDVVEAKTLDPESFLPTREAFLQLQIHMQHIVVQVLCRNLDCLEHLKFPKHLKHAQTEAMNRRSDVVNLGVVSSNPSSTEGVIIIMEHLYKYVVVIDGTPVLMICSGDGLSLERMLHALLGRANGWEHDRQLSGLIPCPQEFHKEILLLQDYINLLFRGNSIGAKGTLAQMKQEFNHRSLKKDVKTNVQQVWDMMQFATDAYVVKCALKLRHCSTVDDLPASFPFDGTPEQQMEWVKCLAAEVVDFCWSAPTEEDLATIKASIKLADDNANKDHVDAFAYCCLEDKDDLMIRCCSWKCDRMWFHLRCTNLEAPPPVEEDWFCSRECDEDGTYIYCYCHERKGGKMVQCKLGSNCLCHEWYHTGCIDNSQGTQGDWYCSEKCALGQMDDDPVLNHTKAIMWLGLNHLVRRDAVREGNGPEILQHWQMDMINFWEHGHPKYFIIGHQLLANVAGCMPEHIREDLTWNRLGNLKGEPGRNIGQDLINEFLNCDFKEMLKHSRGRFTDAQVTRCAQMGGAFGRQIDRLFTVSSLGQYDTRPTYARRDHYKEDIREFCEEYEKDGLFDYLPGIRKLEGFNDFVFNNCLKCPEKMGQKIHVLSQRIDSRKDIARRDRVEQ